MSYTLDNYVPPISLAQPDSGHARHQLADYAGYSDDAPLCGYGSRGYVPSPNEVMVTDLDELEIAIAAACDIQGVQSVWDLGELKEHEGAHAARAAAAGFRQQLYGVSVKVAQTDRGERLSWNPFHVQRQPRHDPTKLEIGAIFAAPMQPSAHDMEAIAALGYMGVQDVGRRVSRHNSSGGGRYIVPPSLCGAS